jgi:hypothetical protein
MLASREEFGGEPPIITKVTMEGLIDHLLQQSAGEPSIYFTL